MALVAAILVILRDSHAFCLPLRSWRLFWRRDVICECPFASYSALAVELVVLGGVNIGIFGDGGSRVASWVGW